MEEGREVDELVEKKYNISCCCSYLTPKGRCYTCPEMEDNLALDGKEAEKDPDKEEY